LGIDIHIDIDFRTLPVEGGDIFILTTDGVHDFLNDEEILLKVADHHPSLDHAAKQIVNSALYAGSNDNLTCQILRVETLPEETENEFYNKLTKLPFPPDLSPGMVLDGYRVIRELLANKRVQIYLAQDTETGQRVVLKTPSANYEDNPSYIDMFVHEDWIGKRLRNLHVMRVYPQIRQRKFLYYVAEYIKGETLRQWINDHPKPLLSEVRSIIGQIAIGLRAFHRMEMIHRDIKPENIMIDIYGTVKIIDFGSTKIAGLEEIASPMKSHHLVGTLDYAAVEYFRDQPGSNRSDIFSLGVVAYEMLTGELPYGRIRSKRELPHMKYKSIREFNPEVPAWVDVVLRKSVHPDPVRRYEHISEFIYDLSHPNPGLIDQIPRSLLERNSVAFWRGVSVLLFFTNVLILYYCSK
jgi:serine/threonine protein kinase